MARMTFPQDNTSFIYQGPSQPILTPPRTAIEVFVDPGGTTRADLRTPEGVPIPDSIVYTGGDGLIPYFLGPDNDAVVLYAQVVGTTGLYPMTAWVVDLIENLQSARDFISGHGQPGANDGQTGSFWLDLDAQQLWGPKVDGSSWPNLPIQLGITAGAVPTPLTYQITSPTTEVVVDHSLNYPTVIYLDTEDQQELCGVAYPSPSRVVVTFGTPSTGRLRLF